MYNCHILYFIFFVMLSLNQQIIFFYQFNQFSLWITEQCVGVFPLKLLHHLVTEQWAIPPHSLPVSEWLNYSNINGNGHSIRKSSNLWLQTLEFNHEPRSGVEGWTIGWIHPCSTFFFLQFPVTCFFRFSISQMFQCNVRMPLEIKYLRFYFWSDT